MTTVDGPSADTIETTTVPARTIAGLRARVAVADIEPFFGRAVPAVLAELSRIGVAAAGPLTAVYSHERGQEFDLTVGFPVEGVLPSAAALILEELPAGPAVRTEHVGPYDNLPRTYAALSDWFAARHRTVPALMWEEYLVGPGAAAASGYRTRVTYPLG